MKKFLILSFLFSVKAYGVQCQLYGYDGGGAGSSYYRCPMSNREAPGIVDVISSWDNPNNKVNAAISDLTKTNPNTEEISAKDLRKISSKIPSDCWKYLKKAANTGACSVFVGRGHDKSCAKVNVNELRRLGYSYRTSLGYLSSEKRGERRAWGTSLRSIGVDSKDGNIGKIADTRPLSTWMASASMTTRKRNEILPVQSMRWCWVYRI